MTQVTNKPNGALIGPSANMICGGAYASQYEVWVTGLRPLSAGRAGSKCKTRTEILISYSIDKLSPYCYRYSVFVYNYTN